MSFESVTPARYARFIPQRYRLEAGYCKKCDRYYFPPRLSCACDPKCDCDEPMEIRTLPDIGELLTFTIVHTPGSQFSDERPFAIGIVELAPGARITAQIADTPFDQIKIGMKVKIEFRRVQTVGEGGVLAYGYKVVPV
ncbi:MAG TPA: Zn-ribbon domain-containing OB-fold protein [Firmicutes bacterium]|nr:Zn-ribbon domain-containing OB-fold protein [Bacillota bacterium]